MILITAPSPLENYLRKIQKWSNQGKTYTDIANLLSECGVTTTRHSVRRILNKDPNAAAIHAPTDKLAALVDAERERVAALKPWGLGGPGTLHLPAKKGSYEIIGLFDLHGEFREEALFQAQLRLIRETRPDLVVLGGDVDNFDIISRWQDKILKRMTPNQIHREIKSEIDDGKTIREQVREAMDGYGLLIETEGNHGDRLRKYLSDDLQEGWETSLEWRGLNESVDGYYNRAGVFIRDKFLVRHGDTTAQYPAAKEFRDKKCSGWSGHLHVVHSHWEPPFNLVNERGIHTIAPASCRLDYNYGPGNAGIARWYQGCLIGSFSSTDHHDHVTDVGLWNGKHLRVRGELY